MKQKKFRLNKNCVDQLFSGFLTAALSNLATGQSSPLSIAIPSELWVLMGISTTSLVGSPLITSTKKGKEAKEEEREPALALVARQKGVMRDEIGSKGQVVCYLRSEIAQWSDLFKGEEVGNAAQLDLAKIQMFYFTLVLILAYAVALGKIFACDANLIDEFPALDASIVALLSISHAGYLTNKAIPHSAIK